jgi:hypothetical protein
MNEFERKILDTVEYSNYVATFADPSRKILNIESYAYSVDALAANITSAATQTFNLVMDSDSDFVLMNMMGGAQLAAGGAGVPKATRCVEFSPALLIQIKDLSSSRTFFNMPTPLPLIAGTGGLPFMLSSPRVIKPRSTLAVSAIGAVAGATFTNFYFTLSGAKIYYA